MRQRWTTIVAFVTGCALAIGGGSLALAQGQSATVNLTSQNNSGIAGTATLTELGAGKMRIAIQVTGAGAGPQPAHIHEGTCANLNPAPKFALTSLANGTSTTEVDGSMQQLTSAPHAIHLHKSPDELPIYVACADIRAAAQPSGQAGSGQPGTLPNAGEAPPAGLDFLFYGLALMAGGLVVLRLRRA